MVGSFIEMVDGLAKQVERELVHLNPSIWTPSNAAVYIKDAFIMTLFFAPACKDPSVCPNCLQCTNIQYKPSIREH